MLNSIGHPGDGMGPFSKGTLEEEENGGMTWGVTTKEEDMADPSSEETGCGEDGAEEGAE